MGKDNPRKDEYIETAARLFLEKGYNETSVRDILDAAGDSSPSVLYYYFKSKEDLYRQVMDTKAKKYLQAIDAVMNKDQEAPLTSPIRKVICSTCIYRSR